MVTSYGKIVTRGKYPPPSLRDTSAGGGQEIAIFAVTPQPFKKGVIVFDNQSVIFISNKEKEIVCAVS